MTSTFDAVFVHDAIDYMTTEADLTAAFAAIAAHLAPGIAVLMGDATTETFEPGTETGGTDGRGVRYIEWTWDRDPDDHHVQTEYAFALRTADGTVSTVHETHHFGLFRTNLVPPAARRGPHTEPAHRTHRRRPPTPNRVPRNTERSLAMTDSALPRIGAGLAFRTERP